MQPESVLIWFLGSPTNVKRLWLRDVGGLDGIDSSNPIGVCLSCWANAILPYRDHWVENDERDCGATSPLTFITRLSNAVPVREMQQGLASLASISIA